MTRHNCDAQGTVSPPVYIYNTRSSIRKSLNANTDDISDQVSTRTSISVNSITDQSTDLRPSPSSSQTSNATHETTFRLVTCPHKTTMPKIDLTRGTTNAKSVQAMSSSNEQTHTSPSRSVRARKPSQKAAELAADSNSKLFKSTHSTQKLGRNRSPAKEGISDISGFDVDHEKERTPSMGPNEKQDDIGYPTLPPSCIRAPDGILIIRYATGIKPKSQPVERDFENSPSSSITTPRKRKRAEESNGNVSVCAKKARTPRKQLIEARDSASKKATEDKDQKCFSSPATKSGTGCEEVNRKASQIEEKQQAKSTTTTRANRRSPPKTSANGTPSPEPMITRSRASRHTIPQAAETQHKESQSLPKTSPSQALSPKRQPGKSVNTNFDISPNIRNTRDGLDDADVAKVSKTSGKTTSRTEPRIPAIPETSNTAELSTGTRLNVTEATNKSTDSSKTTLKTEKTKTTVQETSNSPKPSCTTTKPTIKIRLRMNPKPSTPPPPPPSIPVTIPPSIPTATSALEGTTGLPCNLNCISSSTVMYAITSLIADHPDLADKLEASEDFDNDFSDEACLLRCRWNIVMAKWCVCGACKGVEGADGFHEVTVGEKGAEYHENSDGKEHGGEEVMEQLDRNGPSGKDKRTDGNRDEGQSIGVGIGIDVDVRHSGTRSTRRSRKT